MSKSELKKSSQQNSSTVIGEVEVNTVDLVRNLKADGIALKEILNRLVQIAEDLAVPGSAASILVLNHEGLLVNGASPKLPADYLEAIDRLKPSANVGTCAAAAATGEIVITPSFFADDKWAELKHLPMGLGYHSAWSVPIKDHSGKVLGTFGIYFRELREPSWHERNEMQRLVEAAAIALTA